MSILIYFETKRKNIIDYIIMLSSSITSENHIFLNFKARTHYSILLNYEKFQEK